MEGLGDGTRPIGGFTSADLAAGQVSVVNFWASWCVPCVQEHPLLVALKERTGVRLYGVNYKDQAAAARRFLGRYGNPFAAVGVDGDGRAAIEWGVYGMPETFVVDGKGRIAYKHVGPISAETLETKIIPGNPGRAGALKRKTRNPASADSSEPDSTPSRSCAACAGSVKASMPMNKLIVKPMPPSMPTPRSWAQLAPSGLGAKRLTTASQVAPKMPSGLPTRRPSAMPSGIGSRSLASDRPCSDTPALAKANSGRMANATHGCRLSSSCSSKVGPPVDLGRRWRAHRDGDGDDNAGQRGMHAQTSGRTPR